MSIHYRKISYCVALLLLGFLLAACGGGGGGSSASGTTVSGTVMAGPVSGSTVIVKNSVGTTVAGPVTTGTDGSYTVTIPAAAMTGDLVFEASGGTFPDEATAPAVVTLTTLSAQVAAGSLAAGTQVTIDPASTIIHKLMAGGQTRTAAFTSYSSNFGYKPDCRIKPAFANLSSAATRPERLSGLRTAAFSQLASNMGIQAAKQFDLIHAIGTDLADGTIAGGSVVDGKTVPPDVANRYGEALITYQQSANNKSRLKADQIGAPVFIKTAYTDTYKVEYLTGTMAAVQGKTMFKIRLTNRVGGAAATGKAVTLRPYMYMSTKSHSTPMESVVESSTPGEYDCTVYYVMSTAMAGVSMGIWELKVTVDGESVKFFPTVAMPMGGTTTLAKLTGVIDRSDPSKPVDTDSIMGMAGKETRTWFLFNDGLSGSAGNNTFKLFLATKEMANSMLTFPAVKINDTLFNEAGTSWPVNTIVVEVSTDKLNWTPATATGNGHWSVSGLTGLAAGTQGSIYVKLTVNGLQKTTDGNLAGASNGYQTFTVTPMPAP